MDLAGTYTFDAPRNVVWTLLTDPAVVASCLPGCDRFEPLGQDRYHAVLTLSVAAIGGQYAGTVALLDQQAPHSYRLVVDGKGKAGFVKGEATISLDEHAGSTTVVVAGRGQAGGLIASVGQRLQQTVSKMMMDRFFACLQARLPADPTSQPR